MVLGDSCLVIAPTPKNFHKVKNLLQNMEK
jgi:hypothetical protein